MLLETDVGNQISHSIGSVAVTQPDARSNVKEIGLEIPGGVAIVTLIVVIVVMLRCTTKRKGGFCTQSIGTPRSVSTEITMKRMHVPDTSDRRSTTVVRSGLAMPPRPTEIRYSNSV